MTGTDLLKQKLKRIDGQDYGSYQSLKGNYHYPDFILIIDQIPKDPYAPPHTGLYRLHIQLDTILPPGCKGTTKVKEIALRDFLARKFYESCVRHSKGSRGTGYSGVITIEDPGQGILERSSVVFTDQWIEIRFFMGMPAAGRKITSRVAEDMFFAELPSIVQYGFFSPGVDAEVCIRHLHAAEDAEHLRHALGPLGLIAFIANGSILPRESGTSDKPLAREISVPFKAPASMETTIRLPHAGDVKGMGIPTGVTLIAGGGYHGKSTLLKAIEAGIYNHIPGDGRELCVSLPETVKVRSYNGRYVVKNDISGFINNLPMGKDTSSFSTENASGSTSQAASICEAVEAGARVLLMDEDTCATNFMIRDSKIQQLVHKADEPITPFIDKVHALLTSHGISTILVLGGIGDYFDVSDSVIQMIRYVPYDVTEKAHQISSRSPQKRAKEDEGTSLVPRERFPIEKSIDPYNEYGKRRIYAKEPDRLHFGKRLIDLQDVEQLTELTQTKALGEGIEYAKRYMDGKTPLKKVIECVMRDLEEKGLDILGENISGHYSWFRGYELAFALNRLRGFDVHQL
jgi:predicted ABC-class ATPase